MEPAMPVGRSEAAEASRLDSDCLNQRPGPTSPPATSTTWQNQRPASSSQKKRLPAWLMAFAQHQ